MITHAESVAEGIAGHGARVHTFAMPTFRGFEVSRKASAGNTLRNITPASSMPNRDSPSAIRMLVGDAVEVGKHLQLLASRQRLCSISYF